MSRPAVGICAAVDRVARGPWDEVDLFIQRTYADAVRRAGGLALVLAPDPAAADDPDAWLDRVDALILAGGSDVDPATYGAVASAATVDTWPERDAFELALANRALARGVPVLGTCRGMEMLNVARGGTLVQDLPGVVGHDRHRSRVGSFGEHEVRLEPGSLAAEAAGAERLAVKSHHHQGVDRLGSGLVATGWSIADGIVEAIEAPGEAGYTLGVLWHPEEDKQTRVFESLVAAARAGVAA